MAAKLTEAQKAQKEVEKAQKKAQKAVEAAKNLHQALSANVDCPRYIFTFGRFQSAHTGHVALVQHMINLAIQYKNKGCPTPEVVIYTSNKYVEPKHEDLADDKWPISADNKQLIWGWLLGLYGTSSAIPDTTPDLRTMIEIRRAIVNNQSVEIKGINVRVKIIDNMFTNPDLRNIGTKDIFVLGQGKDEQKQQGSVFKTYEKRGIIIKANIFGDREEAGGVSATDVRREIGMIADKDPDLFNSPHLNGRMVDSKQGLNTLLELLAHSQRPTTPRKKRKVNKEITIRDEIKILLVKLIAHAMLDDEDDEDDAVANLDKEIIKTIENSPVVTANPAALAASSAPAADDDAQTAYAEATAANEAAAQTAGHAAVAAAYAEAAAANEAAAQTADHAVALYAADAEAAAFYAASAAAFYAASAALAASSAASAALAASSAAADDDAQTAYDDAHTAYAEAVATNEAAAAAAKTAAAAADAEGGAFYAASAAFYAASAAFYAADAAADGGKDDMSGGRKRRTRKRKGPRKRKRKGTRKRKRKRERSRKRKGSIKRKGSRKRKRKGSI
jgi:hypothetical protein